MIERQVAVLASTGGAVLGRCLDVAWFRSAVGVVVVDRECGAIGIAEEAGIAVRLERGSAEAVTAVLAEELATRELAGAVLFFTRLLRGPVLDRMPAPVVNFHPSLLPAFPGLHGFEEAIERGVRFLGTTAHLVNAEMDGGPIVQQSAFAADPGRVTAELRHQVFDHQVRSLLQVVRWLQEGRIEVRGGRVVVLDARYDEGQFSPAIDADIAELVIAGPR